jgi:hypothetical protein
MIEGREIILVSFRGRVSVDGSAARDFSFWPERWGKTFGLLFVEARWRCSRDQVDEF